MSYVSDLFGLYWRVHLLSHHKHLGFHIVQFYLLRLSEVFFQRCRFRLCNLNLKLIPDRTFGGC